ncbi:unnamed protein product [Paramecium sonneborni]|uniref:non-specific serine/threonine protein kinase n=2 Tax=Paramecium sonneborni TaxID=65129 RepID=A0A8S1LB94_9CILI|nr:unnamed protein product [Paramecium sonneborni]
MIPFFLFLPIQILAFTYEQQQQLISDDVDFYLNYNSGNIFDYAFTEMIGKGAFSEVYLGYRVEDQEPVVLKHIKGSRERVVNREIQILKALQGLPNIVQIIDAIKGDDEESDDFFDFGVENQNQETPKMDSKKQSHKVEHIEATIIFAYQNTTRCLDDIRKNGDYSLQQVKNYFKQIFTALNKAHEIHIMHRDIKGSNVLVDDNDNIILIDWGLSQFYDEGRQQSTKMGTRYYKAPELLMKYKQYDYSIDIWAVGCMLADFIFKTHPLLPGKDNEDQLKKIISMLGTNDLYEYLQKYDIKLDLDELPLVQNRIDFTRLINRKNQNLVSKEGIDLLEKIFIYDHKKRINASQALEHAFFL